MQISMTDHQNDLKWNEIDYLKTKALCMHSLDHAISYTEDNNQLFLSTSWLFRSVTCRIEIERGGPLMLTLLQKKVNKGKSCDIQPCDHGRVLSGCRDSLLASCVRSDSLLVSVSPKQRM